MTKENTNPYWTYKNKFKEAYSRAQMLDICVSLCNDTEDYKEKILIIGAMFDTITEQVLTSVDSNIREN